MTTNSICQGPRGHRDMAGSFHTGLKLTCLLLPFKWNNLAAHNAGVTVDNNWLSKSKSDQKQLYLFEAEVRCLKALAHT